MKVINLKTTVVALLLLIGLSASAQKVHYGVHAGANFAVQSEIAEYYSNNNIRTGLHAGIFGNYELSSKFALQMEANYDQKGGKYEDVIQKYDYISVPVLAKYSLGKSDLTALQFNINAGPYASYLINAEAEFNGISTDLKSISKDFEFGVIAGFGMKYPIAKNALVFDLRLGLGLTDYETINSDPSNKYIGVSLGWEF